MRLVVGSAIGALVIVSGSAAQAVSPVSPAFEVTFAKPAADTLNIIASGCADEGETVTSHEDTTITCEISMGRPERIAARIVLREPFTAAPRAFVRYAAGQKGSAKSTVEVSGWAEDSRTPDVRRRVSLAGPRFDARLQAFLLRLGGRVTPV